MKDGKYWEPEYETMSRAELTALQVERLRETVRRTMASPFYEPILRERGITPESIQSLDDLRRLPVTSPITRKAPFF